MTVVLHPITVGVAKKKKIGTFPGDAFKESLLLAKKDIVKGYCCGYEMHLVLVVIAEV